MFTSPRLHLSISVFSKIVFLFLSLVFSGHILSAQTDAAVTKTASVSTASIGDQVTFTVNVINEGTVDLTGVVVTDALPANTIFVTSGGAGTYDSGTGIWSIPSITAGNTATFTVTLEITGEGIIYNQAELTAIDQTDDDSTPGNGDYNEDDISSACVSVPVRLCSTIMDTIVATVPVSGYSNIQWFRDTGSGPVAFGTGSPIDIVAEGSYTFTADNAVGCGAGNCCPLIVEEFCFDLALTKTAVPGTIRPGDSQTFNFTITNQGNIPTYNIEITDYMPMGMLFTSFNPINVSNGWASVGGNPTTTIAGPINPTDSVVIQLVLRVNPDYMSTLIVNKAEISSADNDTDATNPFPTDIDSTPDLLLNNDAGGFAGSPSDNAINGDGTGTPNDTVAATDEDDADPALVMVTQTYDLALTKSITSGVMYEPGDNVTYEIVVTNDGTLEAMNVVVTDRLPAGLTFVSGTGFSATAPHTSTIANLGPGGRRTLTLVAQIDANFQGTTLTNEAEITTDDGADTDSTPDNDDINEDDQEAAALTVIQTYDLALTKAITSGTNYEPGDNVTFEIVVTNDGTLDAANVVVTDRLPAGLTFVSGTGFSATAPHTSTIANLASGASTTLTLVAQIDANFQGTTLTNEAEITTDDGADTDSTPDNDDINEDDQDSVDVILIQVFDLAMTKEFSSFVDADGDMMISVGEMVTYTMTVYNQGTVDADDIMITDYIPL